MAGLQKYGYSKSTPIVDDFEPLKPGWYTVIVSEVKEKPCQKGEGKDRETVYLKVEGGDHDGRVIFQDLFLGQGYSDTAREMAIQSIQRMGRAGGLPHQGDGWYVADTEELVGLKFDVKVVIEASEGYDPRNRVKSFRPVKMSNGESKWG